MRHMLLGPVYMLAAATMLAQSGTAHIGTGIDRDSAAAIEAQARTLMAEAEKNASGLATVTIKKYPDHYTMLTVRTKSGGAEMHADFNDVFIVLEGEATEITGGTIVDPREIYPGETRGEKLEGGVSTAMRKGDIIHIDPEIPHQTILSPGTTFIYYVIKIASKR